MPQKPTFLNPDGLPVGFTKDTYQGSDYIGYTCAACHTSQLNYTNNGKTTAIRIDGGPAMADMVGFLTALEKSMQATLDDEAKKSLKENWRCLICTAPMEDGKSCVKVDCKNN